MNAGIAGVGCLTPLGGDLGTLWPSLEAGERPDLVELENPETGRKFLTAPVPPAHVAHLSREPRLRRSSAISLYAATAAQNAIADSGIAFSPEQKSRLAIVLGVSNGGVQYTRRFYEQTVKQGANAASPLLFPETVYNAPASHIAAMLGVDGATYTLVGDGTVGLQALHFGAELLALGDADHVLVVAAEELDWVLVQAHTDWRLIRVGAGHGAVLAEGAAAVLLSKDARLADVTVPPGESFFSQREAPAAMGRALAGLTSADSVDFIFSGSNGTWADDILASALRSHFSTPRRACIFPKATFGEAIGAGALLQVALAADALRRFGGEHALVASLGWNQQAAAARLRKR